LSLKGFASVPIIDEGRTEVPSHSFTALGVEIVDKDDPQVAAAFSDFRTLKDRPRVADPEPLETFMAYLKAEAPYFARSRRK
jgi:hypothetical protein